MKGVMYLATRTRNYSLTKPDGNDLVNIEDLNDNFDVIDAQLKVNADATGRKQDSLTFDTAPASGSTNPVTSGGIHTALAGKQDDLTQVPTVSSLLETDYLFLERDGAIYKIRASAVIIPSGGDGIETESGDALLTEDGQELLIDTGGDEPNAVTTESGEQLLTESNEAITIN